jgi:CspA family cold shock protein
MQEESNSNSNSNSNKKYNGQVKWFNSKKGFGFITYTNDGGHISDIFVHHTCIKYQKTESFRNLISGEYVEFMVSPCPGKPNQLQAESITGVNGGHLLSEVRNNRLNESRTKA